ncbi:hypothetical protein [Paraburkholderia silvatlantica]|uniref:hypothetical protein n=1 Tax=Paraburkholderia silvatlantica TaxID=321895 RepID=UPI00105CFB92|nr:hypothetical protein [Paraburkholderia silvatlantica]TDR04346.1 hypothetical protein C7412_102252 [Paraburkholderia silvatlantica]
MPDFEKAMALRRARLADEGYKRVSVFLSAEVRRVIAGNRRLGESPSGTINRLLTAGGGDSPHCVERPAEARRWEKLIQRAQNEIRHSQRPSNTRGPRTLSMRILRPDGSGWFVTADDAWEFSKADYERIKAADDEWEIL